MSDSERRKDARVEVRKLVKLRRQDADIEEVGVAHDISAKGVRVRDCHIVPVGELVRCNILFSPRHPIEVACRVMWTSKPDSDGFGEMGLTFEDITDGREGRLAELVERLGSGKGPFIARDLFAESGTWSPDGLSRSIEQPPLAVTPNSRVYSSRTVTMLALALVGALVGCAVLGALLFFR
ncbi:MAG: PilZ domain-containing protein [Deltaproteobacteria bacterium]|nr:PilZ domain-containing protein [Deltaproteobacteria bacterium]